MVHYPAKTEGDSFTVKVAVTDLGGRVSENNVLITMDGDYTKPILLLLQVCSLQILILYCRKAPPKSLNLQLKMKGKVIVDWDIWN